MKEQLHWLDIPARVSFKLCALAFRCLHDSAPPYLKKCCTRVIPRWLDLRSATAASGRLVVPKTNTKTISARGICHIMPSGMEQFAWRAPWRQSEFRGLKKKIKNFSLLVYIASMLICLTTMLLCSTASHAFEDTLKSMSIFDNNNNKFDTLLLFFSKSLSSKTDDHDLAFQGHWRSNWLRYPIRNL